MRRDKTERLLLTLRAEIETGRYSAGETIPSERLLSSEYALSRTTVRRAIEALVEGGLLVRRPGAGTFVAERPAAGTGRADPPTTIAFVIPTFSNPLYGEMIDGIEQEARRSDLRVLAGQSNYDTARERDHLARHARDPAVGGAIVVPANVDAPSPAAFQFLRAGKALVFLGRWPEGIAADGICADYRRGAYLAVSHLIELGHQRIAYIEGLPRLPGFSPYEGYAAAMRAAHLPIDPAMIKVLDLPSEQAGIAAVRQLFGDTPPTAIFARNDVTASGVIRGLKEAGLRIPADVSVTSMNNSQLAEHMDPPLTSADPFAVELGRQAFRLLHDRISARYDGPVRRITLDPKLVVRGSAAALPAARRMHG